MAMPGRYSVLVFLGFAVFLAVLACIPKATIQASTPRSAGAVPFFSQTSLQNQLASDGAPLFLGNDRSLMLWEYGCGVASLAMVFRHHGVETDVVRLNEALRKEGAFGGALLAWDRSGAFRRAAQPWIEAIEPVRTTRPRNFQQRVDDELAANRPVIAFLGARHYVVIVGKVEGGGYLINDPWALTAAGGQAIALEKNSLNLSFDDIRQFVFIYPDRNAPTNGIAVSGSIADKYYSLGGSKGSLGNPTAAEETLAGGGRLQRFEHGAILAPPQGVFALHGLLWEKFEAEGGMAEMGVPRSDSYSYFVGPAVEWRADFADASIVWTEGERRARLLTQENALRAEYFANPDLAGAPVYTRFEEELLFDWRGGAPGPWVEPDGFSARYTATISVGGFGWWYNFVVDADDGIRIFIDSDEVLTAWTDSAAAHRFTHNLGRGEHTLVVEYREEQDAASLRAAWSAWPASPVFASEQTVGSFELLPASATESMPDLSAAIAQSTAVAAAVIATLTAEAQVTPTPANSVLPVAEVAFNEWAASNGEPYRDVQMVEESNDGFFATVRVLAWFRPAADASWEERETAIECRQVGGVWRCDRNLRAALSAGEVGRRSATATAVAVPTATAVAIAQATAQAQATAAAPASGSLAIPQGIGDWITAWTLTEQEGDDLFCFGPCPKLCGSGCDNLEITVFNSLDTTDADRANGIAAKWCAEVELIAKNDDGLWADKRLYYEIAQTGGQITLLDDTFWNPALGQTPTCRATARTIDPAQAAATTPVFNTAEEILIPAGSFQMGCDSSNPAESCNGDEQPLHTVMLDAYSIDKYEVTNARYKACVDAGGCEPPQEASSYTRAVYFGNPEFADYPMIKVNWHQASAFCAWEGKRLPTEAEWEKAARGTDGRIYPWGDQAPTQELANFDGNVGDTTPVGSYPAGASPYGVMDMAGNVWEWVNDWYDGSYYSQSPSENPQGPASGEYRVLRGGSWGDYGISVRSAIRYYNGPGIWYYSVGFRCVRSL